MPTVKTTVRKGSSAATDLSALKSDELRALAKSKGLPTKGTKSELIQRLSE